MSPELFEYCVPGIVPGIAGVPGIAAGLAMLGHELVHVGQYRLGMSWVSYFWRARRGYANSPDEVPAYDLQRKIYKDMTPKRAKK